MRNGLVIARQVFEDPLGRAVCSKGSQFEACSSKLVGAIQNTELSAHCGVDSAAQIMEAIMGFGRGALLWLIGIPLPIILLLALFMHH
jgi:hypothetical protein